MKKKLISSILITALILGISACGKASTDSTASTASADDSDAIDSTESPVSIYEAGRFYRSLSPTHSPAADYPFDWFFYGDCKNMNPADVWVPGEDILEIENVESFQTDQASGSWEDVQNLTDVSNLTLVSSIQNENGNNEIAGYFTVRVPSNLERSFSLEEIFDQGYWSAMCDRFGIGIDSSLNFLTDSTDVINGAIMDYIISEWGQPSEIYYEEMSSGSVSNVYQGFSYFIYDCEGYSVSFALLETYFLDSDSLSSTFYNAYVYGDGLTPDDIILNFSDYIQFGIDQPSSAQKETDASGYWYQNVDWDSVGTVKDPELNLYGCIPLPASLEDFDNYVSSYSYYSLGEDYTLTSASEAESIHDEVESLTAYDKNGDEFMEFERYNTADTSHAYLGDMLAQGLYTISEDERPSSMLDIDMSDISSYKNDAYHLYSSNAAPLMDKILEKFGTPTYIELNTLYFTEDYQPDTEAELRYELCYEYDGYALSIQSTERETDGIMHMQVDVTYYTPESWSEHIESVKNSSYCMLLTPDQYNKMK